MINIYREQQAKKPPTNGPQQTLMFPQVIINTSKRGTPPSNWLFKGPSQVAAQEPRWGLGP